MFAYCGNNPISRIDSGGFFWDTVFDVVSLISSVADVIDDPTDVGAWVGLAFDVADVLIPCVGGLGEAADAINATRKAVEAADDAHDASKTASMFVVIGENQDRVIKFADEYGLDYLKMQEGLGYGEMMDFNKKWIDEAMSEGKMIIDIGPDFGRRIDSKYISEFYEMERTFTKGYHGYIQMFIRNGNSSVIG